MKLRLLTGSICLAVLTSGGQANAGTAIDGKEYKKTIPVTEENYSDAEAEVNFIKWKKKGVMNKLFSLTQVTPAGPMPTIRMNRDTLYTVGLVDATNGFIAHRSGNFYFSARY